MITEVDPDLMAAQHVFDGIGILLRIATTAALLALMGWLLLRLGGGRPPAAVVTTTTTTTEEEPVSEDTATITITKKQLSDAVWAVYTRGECPDRATTRYNTSYPCGHCLVAGAWQALAPADAR